ncbi:stage III sporulation protein AB [Limnochorda pilosa]|uniref:Stage III sporulation protein AB n=1 Tax=Limnochorda pilosa TaxID=1555112 RepID=A0A0K2SMU5_LIMPI|nr:stage III sporulation protein AB [Limnochorda pilosa]
MAEFGAGLAVLASTLAGQTLSWALSRRVRLLEAMEHGLALLEGEISYGQTPLPEACRRVAAQVGAPWDRFWVRVAAELGPPACRLPREAWLLGVDDLDRRAGLTPEDRVAIARLGDRLGVSDSRDQVRLLELTRRRLADHRRAAERRWEREARLWPFAGFSAGALVVLILY